MVRLIKLGQLGDRVVRRVLSKELLIGHGLVVELVVVVLGIVEELPVSGIQLVVVLGIFNVEVGDPAQLTVDVPLFCHLGVVWHPGSFHFILLIRVQLSLGCDQGLLFVLARLAEELLHESQSRNGVLPCRNDDFSR